MSTGFAGLSTLLGERVRVRGNTGEGQGKGQHKRKRRPKGRRLEFYIVKA